MQHSDLCVRAYFSWNRVVENMIELAGGSFAELFPGVCVELIAEHVDLARFIGLALRLIKPSSVNKSIRSAFHRLQLSPSLGSPVPQL